MFFSKVPGYFLKEGYYLHIVPMTLLVLNAFLICLLSLEISKDKIRARCMVLFYLLIPAHLDVFLFPYQWQMFVAESFLLISFLNFRVNEKKFLTSLIVAICLNTKLVFLALFFAFLKEIDKKSKSYLLIVFISVLTFSVIGFYQNDYIVSDIIKTAYYQVISIVAPLRLNGFNAAVLLPDYNTSSSLIIMSLIFFFLGGALYFSRNVMAKIAFFLYVAFFLGIFIPEKYILGTGGHSYYHLPTTYFLIPLIVLILLNWYWEKIRGPYVLRIVLGIIALFWGAGLFSWQQSSTNIVNMWRMQMNNLPEKFNYEEDFKLTYAKLLIKYEKYDEAYEFIMANKHKYPIEDWYQMLLIIHSKKNDQKSFEKVYQELKDKKIPYKP